MRAFAECPFVYAAGRKLHLSDEPALDLELDPMKRGSLLHAVAEELAREPFDHDRSEEALGALVDDARVRAEVRLGDERMWPVVRAQHVRLARMFMDFEREWRARFPRTFTLGREVAFRCGWDLELGRPTATVGDVVLAGRIDRVDRDDRGRAALIDYKGSDSGLVNWASWSTKDDVQMPLYAALLEDGLAGVPAMKVVAANYYVIKHGDRRKGFHLRDESAELYDATFKHQNFLNETDKERMFADVRARVTQAIVKMREGLFNPNPKDPAMCTTCTWRTVCRAPHLN